MNKNNLVLQLQQEVKGLTSYLVNDDYRNAADDASRETGWSFPVEDGFQTLWIKQRAKRHLFFYLLSESAIKFKVEQINLQHKFDHFKILVEDMDQKFEDIQESRPEKFAGVDVHKLFGTKIDAGFSSDFVGRDTTYSDDNKVVFTPTEND
jgi:hypothetical protein